MRECNRCHKKEGVHRWGAYVLCDECHVEYSKEAQSEDKNTEIKISEETGRRWFGFYRNGENTIYLIQEMDIEETVNHEYMHHILNIRLSPQTSYNYDNISHEIDPYHTLS